MAGADNKRKAGRAGRGAVGKGMAEEVEIAREEELKEVCEAVLSRIKPSKGEIQRVKDATEQIIRRINEKAREYGIPARAICVGSVARNTWIRGEEDIDIFILFPEEFSEEELHSEGLRLAKSVASEYEERYASHPYIHAFFEFPVGKNEEEKRVEADLVPCFAVRSASAIKSAVDRTPFHNDYLKERIKGLEDDVLLLKQFLRALDIYGSELKTMGFSGYLCELLILHYRSFINLLKEASHWNFGTRIDIEKHGTYKSEGKEPLIVIDPVDPKRNVAAALSTFAFCRFIDAARSFLRKPSQRFFFTEAEEVEMSKEAFLRKVKERGTDFVMLVFDAPPVVDDILFPQLRKAAISVRKLIERNEFVVFRHDFGAEGGKAFLLFEVFGELPAIQRREGPPVTVKVHAERFKRKHLALNHIVRIDENGRLFAEFERKYRSVVELLSDKRNLLGCSLGKHVSEAIERGYKVLKNEEIEFFEGIGKFFKRYFSSTVSNDV